MAGGFLLRTLSKVLRRVSFESYGREGAVIYHEGLKTITFYMEFGGSDVIFFLQIPSKNNWESVTGFDVNERDEIIKYVAENTQRHQAPSCYFEIMEEEIYFKKKPAENE